MRISVEIFDKSSVREVLHMMAGCFWWSCCLDVVVFFFGVDMVVVVEERS